MSSVTEIQRRKVGTSFPLESRRCMCANRFHSPKYMNIQLFPVGWDFVNLATPTKRSCLLAEIMYLQLLFVIFCVDLNDMATTDDELVVYH